MINSESTYEICNIKYDNELNNRLHKRVFPKSNLQPNFEFRPISTKYTKFLVETPQEKISEQNKMNYKYFNPHQTMYTGNANGPVHYALDNVDVESKLQNRFFALQKNDQATYVPPLHSQLYKHTSNLQDKPMENTEYFENVVYTFNPDQCNLAPSKFNNATRNNLRNL